MTALDGVSFDVEKGRTLGLIGENGSGKSTMLKIVAGIAKPTSGSGHDDGQGLGPHRARRRLPPRDHRAGERLHQRHHARALTKKEITAKFDEIVRFAELEEFIDAPVKTYSSGMYMRLGFSVAINVNPEILLIDEVLAVGDASFIPKCLDRIDDFRRRKKTILFVSHDLATVEKICDRVVWLKNGRVTAIGEPKRIVDAYLQDVAEKQEKAFEKKSEEAASVGDAAAKSGGRTGGGSARSRSAR